MSANVILVAWMHATAVALCVPSIWYEVQFQPNRASEHVFAIPLELHRSKSSGPELGIRFGFGDRPPKNPAVSHCVPPPLPAVPNPQVSKFRRPTKKAGFNITALHRLCILRHR